MSQSIYPEPLMHSQRQLPWMTLACVVVLLVLMGLSVSSLWSLPFEGHRLLPALLGFLLWAPVVEFALGRSLFVLALMLCSQAAIGLQLINGDGPPVGIDWVYHGVLALGGCFIGLFSGWRVRPGYYASVIGGWHWPALALAALGLATIVAAATALGAPLGELVLSAQVIAAGFVCGVILQGLGLVQGHAHQRSDNLVVLGLHQVRRCLRQHRLARARQILARLRDLEPDNEEVQQAGYAAWKFDPDHPQFHAAAAALFDRAGDDAETNRFMAEMYRDYLAVTQGKPDLSIDLHLDLAQRFARHQWVDEAANIVNVYLQRDHHHPRLPTALLNLAEGYAETQRPRKAAQYAEMVVGLYPGSPEAGLAKKTLGRVQRQSP